jgi:hypothetical protein
MHDSASRLPEGLLVAVAHVDKRAYLGSEASVIMLLLDAELPPRMCAIKGDYIKMLIPMAPAPFTHTYQLVMTSAAAQKEFMMRVDTLGRHVFAKLGLVVTKWSWNNSK